MAYGISDLLMHWSKPESHPYIDACVVLDFNKGEVLSAESNDEKSDLNIYMRYLPNQTEGGKDLNVFFESAKEKIKRRIAQERKKVQSIKTCLNKKSANECITVSSETKSLLSVPDDYNFTNLVGDARINLLLSYPDSFLQAMQEDASLLNRYQKSYGVFKRNRWKSFTAEELKLGKDALDYYFEVAAKEAKKTPNPQKYKLSHLAKETVKEVRNGHLLVYTELMSRYPVLQFIESETPDKAEVASAVNKMLKSIDEEEKWLEEVTSSIGTGKIHKDLLKILNYREEIQETLAGKNEYCGIARDLKQLADAKGLGFDIGIIAPVMVASFFVPVSYAAAMGIASGGVLSANEHRQVQEASYRVMGRFDPQSQEDLDFLSEKAQARNIELFSTAIAVPGLRFIGKPFKGSRAVKTSIRPKHSRSGGD